MRYIRTPIITDTKEIANEFNSYCSNIDNDLSASIPNVDKCFSDYLVCPQLSSRYSLSLNLKQNTLYIYNLVFLFLY
jgi:hypothetical protein